MTALSQAADNNQSSAELSKARLRLWLKILKATRLIEGELRERLRAEFNTTLPRFDVLAALHRHSDGLKMSDLSGVLKVSNGNVTGIIDRLVKDGQVERVPVAGDRRAMRVRLTASGRVYFAEMADVHEGWISELMESIDAADANQLIELLSAVETGLDSGETAA